MERDIRLFWSAYATAQYLEEDITLQERIDACVNLIISFPLIGTRLATAETEHRRRFVCAGLRIIYTLKETRLIDAEINLPESEGDKSATRFEITITRLKHI